MLFAADLHFGKDDPELAGWLEHQLSLDDDKVLVIPGDFTMGGKEAEYVAAGRFLAHLRHAGTRIIATPGNQDFGRCVWGRYLPSYDQRERYQEHVFPQISGQSDILAGRDFDIILRADDDVFVALRSTHGDPQCPNRIRRDQIDWASMVLSEAQLPTHARLHLVTHRSLWHGTLDNQPDLSRGERLETGLIGRFGFFSFIHGHNHAFHFAHRTTPKLGHRLYHLSVPSITTRVEEHEAGAVRWNPGHGEAQIAAFGPR